MSFVLDGYGEECGIAGGYIKGQNIAPYLYKMILNLQNRGQLSAGISVYNPKSSHLIKTYKQLGTVNEAFKTSDSEQSKKIFSQYDGEAGIAHTRYATFGGDNIEFAHPIERLHGRKYKWFSMCFNGNIANYKDLREKLLSKKDYHLILGTDTEIIMHNISKIISTSDCDENSGPELEYVFKKLSRRLDGSYNIGFLNANGVVCAIRDPLGIHPLSYSIEKDRVFFASESVALSHIGAKDIKDLNPGEMIIIEKGIPKIKRFTDPIPPKHCMFEWVYFANIGSVIDKSSVYMARRRLGFEMAKLETEPVNPDEYVVVPVPDSSKPFGDAYAYSLKLPAREGLVRNRFVGRTFIESHDRGSKVHDKFTLIKEVIKGKKVLLMDDSIVRGNTSKRLISYLKEEGGAKEVHLRVSCPPILCPCFYGIDMSKTSELIASKYFNKIGEDIDKNSCIKIAQEIGADSIIFQKIDNIKKAIGKPDLCMACIDGKYPTKAGDGLYQKTQTQGKTDRIYE